MAKKTKKKGNSGRKPIIPDDVAEEMFGLYLAGIPLKDMAEQYGVSITAVLGARKRKNWDERKKKIEKRVMEARDEAVIGKLLYEKEKQLEMMGMIFQNLYKDILSDYQNKGIRGYRPKLPELIEKSGDIERLIKTYYMIVHGGIAKTESESTNTNKNTVELKISDEDAKTVLRGMADGKITVEEDEEPIKPGNA